MAFRIGQRVCQIEWHKGHPKLAFGTVTRVTKTTYGVNEEKTSDGWFEKAEDAFDYEYRYHFSKWGMVPIGQKGWTVEMTLRAIFRLRRMQRRLRVKLKATL